MSGAFLNKFDGRKKVLIAAIWYIISNVVTRGIGFLTVPIFTRVLTLEEFGKYNTFTSWLSFFTILVTLNLVSTIPRAYIDFEDIIDDYISSCLLLGSITTLCAFLLINLIPNVYSILKLSPRMVQLMFVYLFVAPSLLLFQSKQIQRIAYKKSTILSLGGSTAAVIISLLATFTFQDKLWGRLFGQYGTMTLLCGALYLYMFARNRKIKLHYFKYALSLAIPFLPHALSGNLLNNADRVMISSFCGEEKTALYSLAYNLASVIQMIWVAINQAWTPWMFQKIKSKDTRSIKRLSTVYVLLFAIVVFGLVLFAPEMIFLFAGTKYKESIYIIPPVMIGYFFNMLYSMYANLEIYHKKMGIMSIATMCAAGINIITNYIFIPVFGYVAAAYTTLLSYIFLAIFHYIFMKYEGICSIYSDSFFAVVSGVMLLLCGISTFIYKNMIIRITLITFWVLGVVILLYKFSKIQIHKKVE